MNKYLKILFAITCLFIVSCLYSQDMAIVDSLTRILKKVPEKQKAEIFNKLASEYKFNNPDKAIEYANLALKSADKQNDIYNISFAYYNLGEAYSISRKNDQAKESYLKALENKKEIKNKELYIDILNSYGGLLDDLGIEEGKNYLTEALNLSKEINYYKGKVKSVNYLGYSYYYLNQFSAAIDYFEEALMLSKENNDAVSIETNYRVLGVCYYRQGNYTKAIEKYIEALKISEKLGNKSLVAGNLINIANVYKQQKYFSEALDYFTQAKIIYNQLNDSSRLSITYNNLGNLLKEKVEYVSDTLKKAKKFSKVDSLQLVKDYLQAKNYIDSAIIINEKLKDSTKLTSNYGNRAQILHKLKKYKEAEQQYLKALNLAQKQNDLRQVCIILHSAGELYVITKNFSTALDYFEKGLELSKELNLIELQQNIYKSLSELLEIYGNYKSALDNYKLYIEKKDILFNEESQKTITQMKEIYESDKKQLAIDKANAELKTKEAQVRQQKFIIFGAGVFAFMLIAFIIFVVIQLRLIQRKNNLLAQQNALILAQKEEIQAQRDTVMHQKEEITASIYYAQRIQKAVLPSKEIAKYLLPEHFILFRPRDIVSGDFYWITKKNNKVITVAADCTGHGVPGAFMSMLGVSFLNEIVNKLDKPEAHIILNHLREYVKTTLDQTGKADEAKDGMDISLTIYDFENRIMEYAGAYNPCLIVRKGEPEVIEYKADKMPIGIYIKEKESFTKNIIQLQKGDQVYTFSDGFIDQFGGDSGRKFMSKNFKELLLRIQDKSMDEQREILNTTIDEWRGDIPQIDDIIILGIRIA